MALDGFLSENGGGFLIIEPGLFCVRMKTMWFNSTREMIEHLQKIGYIVTEHMDGSYGTCTLETCEVCEIKTPLESEYLFVNRGA